jgi:hypothetical protein
VSTLAERLLALHDTLDTGRVPHAFGGAIALAYCTQEPRGTRDLDVNIFVSPSQAKDALAHLPEGVVVNAVDRVAIERDGQARLWWDDTPVDVFFSVHGFHDRVAEGVRSVPFEGEYIPVIDCVALAVFKVMFNRTRDWADLEAMHEAGALDAAEVLGWTVRLVGTDDERVARLAALVR